MPCQFLKDISKTILSALRDEKAILSSPIDADCRIIIVIPCHNEPDLIKTMNSLVECQPAKCGVEVIVVVNDAEDAKQEVRKRNEITIQLFNSWVTKSQIPKLKFHLIEALGLPKKTAGVGLARKIGMDEALNRFVSIDQDGAIVCLDADCTVSNTYLTSIEGEFCDSDAGLGHIHYEHQFEQEENHRLREGIINYELFLRYYVEGLRQSKFPNAIQTVGSCMLVKASVYAKHGGMNKRKAGEDFYFLHKIAPHEKHVTVNGGTVFPSCRTSDRVPFGTGKAQQDWIESESELFKTYNPKVFDLLKTINESIQSLFDLGVEQWLDLKPFEVQHFFKSHRYEEKVKDILQNCRNAEQFHTQFYVWFDGFMCMKFIHFLRDEHLPEIPIVQAAKQLIHSTSNDIESLLREYRPLH